VFARIWTRKEAYLKSIGTGVAGDLAAAYVGVDGRAAGPAGWAVIEVPVPDGFAAAAAIKLG
jgi:4'-phosphopantetheinyl transferase